MRAVPKKDLKGPLPFRQLQLKEDSSVEEIYAEEMAKMGMLDKVQIEDQLNKNFLNSPSVNELRGSASGSKSLM